MTGGPWPGIVIRGSSAAIRSTEAIIASSAPAAHGPPNGTQATSSAWSRSPVIATRSSACQYATCPGVWPGVWMTSKPSTMSPSRQRTRDGVGPDLEREPARVAGPRIAVVDERGLDRVRRDRHPERRGTADVVGVEVRQGQPREIARGEPVLGKKRMRTGQRGDAAAPRVDEHRPLAADQHEVRARPGAEVDGDHP